MLGNEQLVCSTVSRLFLSVHLLAMSVLLVILLLLSNHIDVHSTNMCEQDQGHVNPLK